MLFCEQGTSKPAHVCNLVLNWDVSEYGGIDLTSNREKLYKYFWGSARWRGWEGMARIDPPPNLHAHPQLANAPNTQLHVFPARPIIWGNPLPSLPSVRNTIRSICHIVQSIQTRSGSAFFSRVSTDEVQPPHRPVGVPGARCSRADSEARGALTGMKEGGVGRGPRRRGTSSLHHLGRV